MAKESIVSRRDALRLGGIALGSVLVTNELMKTNDEIKTPEGTFKRSYEAHTNPLTPQELPARSQFLFQEYLYSCQSMHSPAEQVLTSPRGLDDAQGNELPLFTPQLLSYAGKNQIYITLGDVVMPKSLRNDSAQAILGEFAAGFGLSLSAFLHSHFIKNGKEDFISRRTYLKKMAYGAGLWLSSPAIGGIVNNIGGLAGNEELSYDINKIDGYQSLLHPEFPSIYVRNIIMAGKLIGLAKYYHDLTDNYAYTTYRVGLAHTGIEFWLQMGGAAVHQAISLIDKGALQKIIAENGGLSAFCSTRIVGLDNHTPLLESGKPNITLDMQIIDLEMKDLLSRKLQ